ncbi:isochorismatase family protein, partial [Candidatus Latescibacterota bacterium]
DQYGISPLVKPKVDRPRVNLRSIFSPKTIDTNIFAETNEIVLGDYDDELLAECLRKNGVTTLIYAGYALNWCVTHRDSGIFNMKNHGFDIIIVRDCTIAFELPETLDGELAKETIIAMIEIHWGTSTTLDDLKLGLSR